VMDGILYNLVGAENTALVLVAERSEAIERSVRNLPNARTLRAAYLNVRDLLSHDRVIIPQDALEVIQLFLGNN
jgi:large subunit ribosomal protein L4